MTCRADGAGGCVGGAAPTLAVALRGEFTDERCPRIVGIHQKKSLKTSTEICGREDHYRIIQTSYKFGKKLMMLPAAGKVEKIGIGQMV